MKILVGIREFREAFGVAGRFVAGAKAASAITSHAKLSVADGVATLVGHDPGRGVGARVVIDAVEAGRDGVCLLPKGVVDQILKSADEETVTLTLDGMRLTIKGATSRWSVNTADPALFPDPAAFPAEPAFAIDAEAWSTLVARTAFATDPLSTKYALGGMLIQCKANEMEPLLSEVTLSATDGRKVATAWGPCYPKAGIPRDGRPVIPAEAARLFAAIFVEPCPAIELGFTDHAVFARCESIEATASLVQGRFPLTRDHWPKTYAGSAAGVPADALSRCISQVSAVISEAAESTGCVRLSFSGIGLTLASIAGEVGESEVSFPAAWDGPPVAPAYRPSFLLAALKPIGSVPVTLSVGDDRADHDGSVVADPTLSIAGPGFEMLVKPQMTE